MDHSQPTRTCRLNEGWVERRASRSSNVEDERHAVYRTGRQHFEHTAVAEANIERTLIDQRRSRLSAARQGTAGEDDEKRVALGPHLDPAVRRERVTDDAAVDLEYLLPAIGTERPDHLCRTLDIGEQHRDGPGGEWRALYGHHAILRTPFGLSSCLMVQRAAGRSR